MVSAKMGESMAMPPTTIHLIRHGEVHNPRQILYGRLPRFRLSDKGRRQAQAAGLQLSDSSITALYSSPMLRARQTAREILLAQTNPSELHICALLNEVCSPFEGRPAAEVDVRNGDVYTGVAACFEQPLDVAARTRRFVFRMRKRYPGGRVAAVTHGDIITFMVLWARGLALTPENKTRLLKTGYPVPYPAHASITTLIFQTPDREERPEVGYIQP